MVCKAKHNRQRGGSNDYYYVQDKRMRKRGGAGEGNHGVWTEYYIRGEKRRKTATLLGNGIRPVDLAERKHIFSD